MRKGLTLIELLVVVTIIGVVMLIAIPNFAAMQRRARINAAAQEVAQDFRLLRERALSLNGIFQVTFPDTRHYTVVQPNGNSMPHKLAATTGGNIWFGSAATVVTGLPDAFAGAPPGNGVDFDNNVLIFDNRGGASRKGVLYITDGAEDYAVGINVLGRVKIYRFGKDGVWH